MHTSFHTLKNLSHLLMSLAGQPGGEADHLRAACERWELKRGRRAGPQPQRRNQRPGRLESQVSVRERTQLCYLAAKKNIYNVKALFENK